MTITKNHLGLAAIIGIVCLEAIALMKGINGVLLTTVIAFLSMLGGYKLGQPQEAVQRARKMAGHLGILLGCLLLASCSAMPQISVCLVHPEFGQVCIDIKEQIYVRADLDPEQLGQLKEWVKGKLGKR